MKSQIKSEVSRSSPQRCSLRKGVLRNFAKLTGKHLFYRTPLGDCFWVSITEYLCVCIKVCCNEIETSFYYNQLSWALCIYLSQIFHTSAFYSKKVKWSRIKIDLYCIARCCFGQLLENFRNIFSDEISWLCFSHKESITEKWALRSSATLDYEIRG